MLVTASAFSVALNVNSCAYGTPEGYTYILSTVTPMVELHSPTQGTTESPVEPATWYTVNMGQYAVIRILSVPDEENVCDGQTGDAICGIEVLSAYNVEERPNTISQLLIPSKDISLFFEGVYYLWNWDGWYI